MKELKAVNAKINYTLSNGHKGTWTWPAIFDGDFVWVNLTPFWYVNIVLNPNADAEEKADAIRRRRTLDEIAEMSEVETLTKELNDLAVEYTTNWAANKHEYFILEAWRCGVGMDEAKFRKVWLADSEVIIKGNYKYDKDGNELLTKEQKWAKEYYLLCD